MDNNKQDSYNYMMLYFTLFILITLFFMTIIPTNKYKEKIEARVDSISIYVNKNNSKKKIKIADKFFKKEEIDTTNLKLKEANVKVKPEFYLMLRTFILPLAGFFYGFFIFREKDLFFILVISFIIAMLMPKVYDFFVFNIQKKKRILAIEESMADFFDLLTSAIEAGLGLNQAIQKVTDEIDGPLSLEFNTFLYDMQLGISRTEAFESLKNRVPSPLFKEVITSLNQASQMGISMGKSIRVQTDYIRKSRYEALKKKGLEAPIKIIFPMVFFIFPVIFIIIFSPLVIQYLNMR